MADAESLIFRKERRGSTEIVKVRLQPELDIAALHPFGGVGLAPRSLTAN
jgi:hypothetical protein